MTSNARKSRPGSDLVAWKHPSFWILVGAIFPSALLLGGARPKLAAVACCIAMMMSIGVIWRHRTYFKPRDPIVYLLSFAILVTIAQVVPIPRSWLETLDPPHAQSLASLSTQSGQAVAYTISYAPGSTYLEILKLIAGIALYLAAATMTRGGLRRHVVAAVAGSTALVAMISVAHFVSMAEHVFGFYAPQYARDARYGPILNPNNLAGLLLLGLSCAAGLLPRKQTLRSGYFFAIMVMAVVLTLTLSRGGIAVGAVTAVIWLAALIGQKIRPHRSGRNPSRTKVSPLAENIETSNPALNATPSDRTLQESSTSEKALTKTPSKSSSSQPAFSGLALAGVLFLAAVGSTITLLFALSPGEVESELRSDDLRKIDLLVASIEFAAQAPALGVGRGAFGSAFAGHFGTYRRAEHAENILAQWVADWGIAVAITLLLGLGYQIIKALGRPSDRPRFGLALGLGALAVQNLVDLGLELPAVAFPAFVALGGLCKESLGEKSTQTSRTISRPLMALVTLCVAGLFSAPFIGSYDREKLSHVLTLPGNTESANGASVARGLLHAFPMEPALALVMAQSLDGQNDPRTLGWLNRAMQLAPGWVGPHVLAAQFLFRNGHQNQAMLEIREAARRDPASVQHLVCHWFTRPNLAEPQMTAWAESSMPQGEHRHQFLNILANCLGESTLRERLDDELLADPDFAPNAALRQALRHQARGDFAQMIAVLTPHPLPNHQILLAEAHHLNGDEQRASEVLRIARRTVPSPEVLRAHATVLGRLADVTAMRQTLDELRASAAGNAPGLAAIDQFRAQLEFEFGEVPRGVSAYQRALELEETDARLLDFGTRLRDSGNLELARATIARLVARNPNHDGYRNLLRTLEAPPAIR